MDKDLNEDLRQELDRMRAARDELSRAKGKGYLTTSEAVDLAPFAVTEETLLRYPEWILPRRVKNPRAKRKTYLWDPGDLLALPAVLTQWQQARSEGLDAESDFRERRLHELGERDLRTLGYTLRETAA